jgi:hypothetical protein
MGFLRAMITRMEGAKTPGMRIAVAVETHARNIRNQYRKTRAGPERPDYMDLGAMLEPYVKRERVLAQIELAEKLAGGVVTPIMIELGRELFAIEASLPPEHRL